MKANPPDKATRFHFDSNTQQPSTSSLLPLREVVDQIFIYIISRDIFGESSASHRTTTPSSFPATRSGT